ncbi:A/G-specific adenine glycosylase [Blattabacterium cuenoti]|uniref:A/G-specific adenine glycosylase n=1 Tax=Blattabacterium cuenoti TaxID=1653831 RepID=UPI00163BAF39|nr:A/G-specific adenine glycosylase [Blattabacterium cuenoti]
MNFSKKIIKWYNKNKRNLPWRKTNNPYHILVSEFMLQQTKVSTVIRYYSKFIEKFPTIQKLSQSNEKSILKSWEGLGYYFRGINLYYFAKEIVNNKRGIFPKTYKNLIKYKGIGPYIAASISSICFQEIVPAIDTNAYRVFSRFFGINHSINIIKRSIKFQFFVTKMMDSKNPGIFNQSIMDLGAMVCTIKKWKCEICPVKKFCFSRNNHIVNKYPIKTKKKNIINNFYYYIYINKGKNHICFKKRDYKGIWGGLYDFPLIKSKNCLNIDDLKFKVWNKFRIVIPNRSIYQIKHKLSHINLFINFFCYKMLKNFENNILYKKYFFIAYDKMKNYPFPIPIISFLKHQRIL